MRALTPRTRLYRSRKGIWCSNEVEAREGIDTSRYTQHIHCQSYRSNEVEAREGIDTVRYGCRLYNADLQ